MASPRRKPQTVHRSRSQPSHFRARRRARLSLRTRIVLITAGLFAVLLLWAVAARITAPGTNTKRATFDAIVILGTPADSDGNPTPELLDRITEGVHEYERGMAPHLIVTGGAAHNHFVEADVMAGVARAQGVPASAIIEEAQALDTIQNACYSEHILKAHGWRSVEVVSSVSHLPRAAMIFSRLPVEFRMHAAPANLTPGYYSRAAALVETLKTARYLVWSRWVETCSL